MWRRRKLKSVLGIRSLASSLVQDGVLAWRPYDLQPWLFATPLQKMRAQPGKDLPMPRKRTQLLMLLAVSSLDAKDQLQLTVYLVMHQQRADSQGKAS